MGTYSEAQLSKFRRLLRLSSRWLFSGDLTDRIRDEVVAHNDVMAQLPKQRKKKVNEANLAVVVMDALSYHEGWVSEDKFAEKLHLGGKQVRKVLQELQRQGFVVREHRREKKKGNKVESVAEYEEIAAETRTASYVSIDYPHMFDMLRLRIHLAKKAAADQIDDGETLEKYACCSRDGVEQVCGQKYDSIDMSFLETDSDGLYYLCSTCDFGIVAPDDDLSRTEPNGIVRIKRVRFRREAANLRKQALLKAVAPLDAMVAELEAIDPPDFGSFTDWAQRRQDLMRAGQAQAEDGNGRRGGGARGALDYGIDGPLTGDAQVNVDFAEASTAAVAQTIALESVPVDPRSNLPYFMRTQNGAGPSGGSASVGAAAATAEADSAPGAGQGVSDADRERYEAFKRQFAAQMASRSRSAGTRTAVKSSMEEEKVLVKEEDILGQEVVGVKRGLDHGETDDTGTGKRAKKEEDEKPVVPKAEDGAEDDGLQWEDADEPDAGGLEWEDV